MPTDSGKRRCSPLASGPRAFPRKRRFWGTFLSTPRSFGGSGAAGRAAGRSPKGGRGCGTERPRAGGGRLPGLQSGSSGPRTEPQAPPRPEAAAQPSSPAAARAGPFHAPSRRFPRTRLHRPVATLNHLPPVPSRSER